LRYDVYVYTKTNIFRRSHGRDGVKKALLIITSNPKAFFNLILPGKKGSLLHIGGSHRRLQFSDKTREKTIGQMIQQLKKT